MSTHAKAPSAGPSQRKVLLAIGTVLALALILGVSVANALAPTVTIENASDVSYTTAQVKGTVDRSEQSTTYRFQYVTQASFEAEGFDNPTTGIEATLEEGGPGAQDVEGTLEGLTPDTTYHLRLYAENADGSNVAVASSTFETDFPATPVPATEPATDPGYTRATLNGTIDPDGGGAPINWYFEYAPSSEPEAWSYAGGNEISAEEAANATEPIDVSLTAENIAPGREYIFRLNASNAAGSAQSPEPHLSFETEGVAKPTVTLEPVSSITGESALLSGEVDPNDPEPLDPDEAFSSTCTFEYISAADYQARDEIQRLAVKASGGTFTLEFEGQVTEAIAFNASAAAVQTALEELSNIDPGDVTVSGGPGNLGGTNPYIFTFPDLNPGGLWADPSALTGPGKAIVKTLAQGFNGQDELQELTVNASAGTYTLAYDGQSTGPITFDADASAVQSALEALATIGAGNVSLAGGPGGSAPLQITFTGALGDQNAKPLVANQAGLTATGEAEVQTTTQGREAGFEGATPVPCDTDPVTGSAQDVEAELTNLEPGVIYHVRLRAENLGGVSFSTEQSFTTTSLAPTAITHLVANLLSDSVRLTGFVDPQNELTTYYFEWGAKADLSDAKSLPASEDASAGSGGQQIAVGEDLANLAPNTIYYYRLVTDNPTGPPSLGEIESFTTRPSPPPMGDGVGAFGDRVNELVSEPVIDGNTPAAARMSANGNRAVYGATFGGTDHSEYGSFSYTLAERTSAGWVSRRLTPPRSQIPNTEAAEFYASSPDLSRFLFRRVEDQLFGFRGSGFFSYGLDTGAVSFGHQRLRGEPGFTKAYVGDDRITHWFGQSKGSLADPSATGGLYDYSTNPATLVGYLPGEVAPSCGVVQDRLGDFPVEPEPRSHWVSSDGKYLHFLTRGNGDCGSDPRQLYRRQASPSGSFTTGSGASTVLVSGPVISGPDLGATFIKATPDGTSVFFTSASILDPDDLGSSPDLYRNTVGIGNECITCFAEGVNPNYTQLSEDGSQAYFVSTRALAPGAIEGKENLYVWRVEKPEDVQFIAPAGPAPGGRSNLVTPDGSTLVFGVVDNRTTALDPLTGNETAQIEGPGQIYRFSAEENSLTCLSCGRGVPKEAGADPYFSDFYIQPAYQTILSDDGEVFAFKSLDPLVPEDTNGDSDIYEWRQGRLGLLTDGSLATTVGQGGGSAVSSVSADGKKILFRSWAAPGPESVTGREGIYQARVGGGFPRQVPPAPCAGDGCRGPVGPAPVDPGPATPSFSGPGNAKPRSSRCAKGKKPRKGRCVKKQQRKHNRNAKRNRGGSR